MSEENKEIIYTKIGDKGRTSLFDATEIFKDDSRVEAYGTVDELNALLGICKHYIKDGPTQKFLHDVQRRLFDVGAELATVDTSILMRTIEAEDVEGIEHEIDRLLAFFEIPEYFVIPGDNIESGYFHLARTVCRRAERRIIHLAHEETINPEVIRYINRLSDYLYSLSRYVEDNYEKVTF